MLLWLIQLLSGSPLPPDYYTPRNPMVTFPRLSPRVSFPAAVTPTVRFTP